MKHIMVEEIFDPLKTFMQNIRLIHRSYSIAMAMVSLFIHRIALQRAPPTYSSSTHQTRRS